ENGGPVRLIIGENGDRPCRTGVFFRAARAPGPEHNRRWRSRQERPREIEFRIRRTLVSVAKICHGELGQHCCPTWGHASCYGRRGPARRGERRTGTVRR